MSASPTPSSPANTTPTPHLAPMLILFFGSGCAALIYEIVWYQMLQLVIGLTTISLGILLASFMGGMCLGSLALSRLVARARHPLKVYAALELGIGIIGVLVLWLMPYVGDVYTQIGHGSWNIVLRAVVAAVCLVPPTLLMGATLPAISRWVEANPQGVSWLGFFYGGNIAGAVFGCLFAGFVLLRKFDMATATYIAAGINLTVAFLAMALASDGPAPLHAETTVTERANVRSPGDWAIYVTIALSGLTALGAEVIWTRLLSLLFGATVYTFSIILAVFLFGLGVGSGIGSLIARSNVRPRVALGACQLLLTAAIAWTAYNISDSLPYWPIDPSLTSNDGGAGPWYIFQMDLARTLWTILPAALLWGASFPLALAAAANRAQDPAKLVGGIYAANTVGAIFGALLFSLAIVPQIGTQGAQRVLIGLAGFSGLVALLPLLISPRHRSADAEQRTLPTFGVSFLLVMGLVAMPFFIANVHPASWGAIAYGRYMATYKDSLIKEIIPEADVPHDSSADIYCVYAGEGLNGTVAVTKTTNGGSDGNGIRSFHSAGKVQASNEPQDMRLQRLLGDISALAVHQPKTVLVVACGAGVTAGTFLLQPSVERIVICDIEPLVPKYVTPMFTKENYGITDNVINENPRVVQTPVGPKTVEVVYDDGRHFIRTTKEKFDVITSDPIDPWVKGCAALNTVEYYQMCKDHLNPGGVMSLWIPFYESNIPTAKSVLATFFKVYPNGILWSNDFDNGQGYDAVLFGQAEPTKIDVDEWQSRLDSAPFAAVKQSLDETSFHSAVDLLATYAGRASDLQDWMKDAEINEDRNLRLQYLAGMALNSYIGRDILTDITKNYRYPKDIFIGSAASTQALRDAIETPRNIHPGVAVAQP